MTKDIPATLRKATPADLNAIGMLWEELMEFHQRRDPHFTRAADGRKCFQAFVAGHIASDASRVLVAERGGHLVGYCLATQAKYPPVFEHRDYGAVFDLAVTERCRRQGIGERLYSEAAAWFAGRGIRRIEVRVTVSNEVSTAFWRKMGFRPYVATVFKDTSEH